VAGGKFDPWDWEHSPEGIATKFGMNNYVGDPALRSKCGS